jgi:hypothetical protein
MHVLLYMYRQLYEKRMSTYCICLTYERPVESTLKLLSLYEHILKTTHFKEKNILGRMWN